jgi:hypothetical protein
MHDPAQQCDRLIQLRQTIYDDPGNPFAQVTGPSASTIILAQRPGESRQDFTNRSSQWFLAHEDVQAYLRDSQVVPARVTWEADTKPITLSADIPPVPRVPEEYLPARVEWVKMKPKVTMAKKTTTDSESSASSASSAVSKASRASFQSQARNTAFYAIFHEIEEMYRDVHSLSAGEGDTNMG